ncbi:unnamed protein product, partial [Effrenium voratum]
VPSEARVEKQQSEVQPSIKEEASGNLASTTSATVKKTEDGKWMVDTGYIDHRTKDPNRLEPRRSVMEPKDAAAAAAAVVGQSSRDEEGKFKVDTSYINHRTIEVDRLEGRKSVLGADSAVAAHSATVKKEDDGKWKVDTSYIGHRTLDTDNLTRKEEKQEEACYADPAQKKYSHDQLKASQGRPDDVDPSRREQYLSDAEFLSVFGMPFGDFQKQPKWKQQNVKKAKDLFCAAAFARRSSSCDGEAVAGQKLAALLPPFALDGRNASSWRGHLHRLLSLLDFSLLSTSWNRLVFSGWPLLAVLHRLQEAHFRGAGCELAEGYGLLSRAAPRSVWLCLSRGQDLVAERWRLFGEFPDCSQIARAMGDGDGCLFLDVGANLGGCSLQLARQGFAVLALEPGREAAALLGAAAERNGLQRLKVRQAAAGAEQGRARLRCRHSATCQVVADGLDAEVEMVTLDALTRGRPPCALKLDVEGSEEEVILGAAETLGRRPKLFLELHAFELRQRGSSSGRVVDRLLADLKYTKVETLFPDACLESGQGVPKGNGSYPASRWDSAEAFLPPTTEAQPCACARRCWRELRPGARLRAVGAGTSARGGVSSTGAATRRPSPSRRRRALRGSGT